MNLKINIKARLQRHYRNHSFLKQRNVIDVLKKFKIFSILIILILPIYPSFGAIGIDKETAVGNYDESTIIMAYAGESDLQEKTLFSQNSGFIKSETISDNTRDTTGINKLISYTVQNGDSLSVIADKFNVSINSIIWSNDFSRDKVFKPGEIVKIPPVTGLVYKVISKDTVDSIATKFKVDKLAILEQNQIDPSSELKIGQQLIIPGAIKIIPVEAKPAKITSKKALVKDNKTKLKSGYTVKYTGKGNGFAWGNCTYFVANHKNVTWRGNAYQWLANAKAQGVPTGSNPVPGAIISFRGSGYNPYYGHVGIVVDVEGNDVIVKDMNYRRLNEVTVRRVNINDSTIKGYIYTN